MDNGGFSIKHYNGTSACGQNSNWLNVKETYPEHVRSMWMSMLQLSFTTGKKLQFSFNCEGTSGYINRLQLLGDT